MGSRGKSTMPRPPVVSLYSDHIRKASSSSRLRVPVDRLVRRDEGTRTRRMKRSYGSCRVYVRLGIRMGYIGICTRLDKGELSDAGMGFGKRRTS